MYKIEASCEASYPVIVFGSRTILSPLTLPLSWPPSSSSSLWFLLLIALEWRFYKYIFDSIWMHSTILINQDGSFHQTDWFLGDSTNRFWVCKKSFGFQHFQSAKQSTGNRTIFLIHPFVRSFVCLFICMLVIAASLHISHRTFHKIHYFFCCCFIFNRHQLESCRDAWPLCEMANVSEH